VEPYLLTTERLTMPTPHISAEDGAFAKTVLLPGDPLRAKHIAETYFDDPVQVSAIRNMFGYTGTYKGTPLSVMGTGMGVPSASIYLTELITAYGVENLIRVGTCGGIADDLDLRDVIIVNGASTDSGVNRARFLGYDFAATADYTLLRTAVDAAADLGIPTRVGNVFTSDLFYHPSPERFEVFAQMGVLAVEMEAAGLYGVAAEQGARALTVLTVSDHVMKATETTPEDRQKAFTAMMEVACETATRL
jgi:purine-nucleoside phosphorylase